ncbi:amidohydrolase family protein [Gilvimarinus sp. SDUM040013]|uniref:Amidohydrolase family protein n=1 Tax=Gilvimarinus gilvus TaxID=3058038 RepID=A0ABU4S247_9GAMM|nr:amidohydrolase family protein [Gilvimarinus sp. SDUM040013]MDO3384944.1 amidohydrolase family protein [Gilvimarinus sp. SDUM040013]MDX6851260.1 amidohydrolase family protein [Gilvimarinus sp. SDUM040013]
MNKSSPWSCIDAHQHCWQLATAEWPTSELEPIYRDFSPLDFAAAAGPDVASVLVQSQPTEQDTEYLLNLARAHRSVLGVVGWVNLAESNAVQRLEHFARDRLLRGVRPMLQGLQNDRWILQDAIAPALDALVRLDLCFDALVFTRHLPHILALADQYPNLRIVIDHSAKPDIAGGEWTQWYGHLVPLAARSNVYCKLSGLITEAAPGASLAVVTHYAEAVLNLFGSERVLWGSDWPVLNLASEYRQWHDFCQKLVKSFDSSAEKAIFCDNAIKVYGLEPGLPEPLLNKND